MNLQEEKQLLARIRETVKQDATAAVELIMQQIQWATPWREGQPHVLCFNRLRFALDVEQLQKSGRLNYSTLDNGLFNALLDSVTEPHLDDQELLQSFYPANQSPHILQHKAHCARLADLLISHINAVRPVQALLFANMDYRQNWPLEEVCAPRGIKTLCLSREHYVSEYLRSRKKRIFRDSGFKYRGDGIALFGECSVPVFTDPGVCPQDKLFVTGAPRMDRWRDTDAWSGPLDTMTLLSFSGGSYNASQCYKTVLKEFVKFSNSRSRSISKYIVKCKAAKERTVVREMLQNYTKHHVQARLGDLYPFLKATRCLIGINSLALLEGLLSRASIICPFWDDARQDKSGLVLSPDDPDTQGIVHFANSPKEFADLLKHFAARSPENMDTYTKDRRLRLFKKFFHYPENKTNSSEVENFIRKCLCAGTDDLI